jgi:hemerythrin superfamily protein
LHGTARYLIGRTSCDFRAWRSPPQDLRRAACRRAARRPSRFDADHSFGGKATQATIASSDPTGRDLSPTTREEHMDALTLLKRDHDKVKGLLKELEPTTERAVKTRSELFSRIKSELTIHEIIEEEIFYPTLKQHPKAKDIVLEGYEEHNVVDTLMGELETLDVEDETWGAKAKVMIENIEHHIEEEEGEMFEKARQVFDREELEQLGEAMEARKTEAMAEHAFAPR